jgi:hypothetical protein
VKEEEKVELELCWSKKKKIERRGTPEFFELNGSQWVV